jgi:ferrochelatase
MDRVRIILAAHGEAETAGFVENYQVSRHTLAHAAEVMRLPAPLRLAICALGGLRKRWSGGPGSEHNARTREQAGALQSVLDGDGDIRYRVEAAFASSPPYLADAIVAPGDADRQLVVSMIPTDSRLSCGLICQALLAAAPSIRERTTVVARMWDDDELIRVHRDHIAAHAPGTPPATPCCLVLVLHGTIVRASNGGPPGFHAGATEKERYGQALREALLAVADRPWQRVELAYLNHGVGGQWSSPTLPERLEQLAGQGVRSVIAYPCEHLVDGGETVRLPDVLDASGVAEAHRIPCLNASDALIDCLAGRVRAALSAPRAAHRCDPCPMGA